MISDARLADGPSLADNPFRQLRIKRKRGRRDLPSGFLTPAKIDQLAQAALDVHGEIAGPMFQALIYVAAECGLRRGELIALEWSDIDLRAGTVTVARAWNARLRRVDVPKNGETGTVMLGVKSRAALLRLKEQPLHPSLLFTTKTGRPLSQSGMHLLLDPVRQRCNMPELTLHWFRHYTATSLVEAGLSEFDVAQQLRHRDRGDLVRSTYAHKDTDAALGRVAAKLVELAAA
jgi:integrase